MSESIPPAVATPPWLPAAVICDLDGTLIDSAPAMAHAVRFGCAAAGTPLAPSLNLAWCVGPRIEDSLRALVGDELMPLARHAFRDEYRRTAASLTSTMPGARGALGRLRAAGVPLAVATYKTGALASMILHATDLAGLFDTVRARRHDVEDERPKADLLAEALNVLGTGPEDALYVGDHDEDETAAAAVGVSFLRYPDLDWREIETVVVGGGWRGSAR